MPTCCLFSSAEREGERERYGRSTFVSFSSLLATGTSCIARGAESTAPSFAFREEARRAAACVPQRWRQNHDALSQLALLGNRTFNIHPPQFVTHADRFDPLRRSACTRFLKGKACIVTSFQKDERATLYRRRHTNKTAAVVLCLHCFARDFQ
jgi:hypothetical protein